MIRLGNFTKQGYKDNFSKGELARELVCMNNDYDNVKKENQKYKETIKKLKNIIKNDDLYEASDFESRKFQKDLLNVLKEVE